MAKQYSKEEVVRRDSVAGALVNLPVLLMLQGVNIPSPEAYLSIVKFAIGILANAIAGIEAGSPGGEIESNVEAAKKLASDAIEDAVEYSAFLASQTPEE